MVFKKIYIFILLVSIVVLTGYVNNRAIAKGLNLVQLARSSVECYLQGQILDSTPLELDETQVDKVVGVFVTIFDEENNSRGCWGNLYPQLSLEESVIASAIGAVKNDYRYAPPCLYELPELKFQVSLVLDIVPVSSIREINPLKDGMLVQSGGKGGILMPGEAIDPYYQMVQCKLKANIQPDEPYNLFKLVTKVYRE